MRITFNKVTLKNFLSFENAELELDNSGYVLVNGINENPDDLARSNGSGKSSLFEAITWCLTGETIRGTKEVRRIGAEDECSVQLDFDVNNIPYTIIRTKEPSNLKVYFNNEDKSGKGIRDTEKLLEEYLPDLTSQLLGSVVILGQGLPQRFTNNTPAGRKEVLEKLSKSDYMVEDLKKRIMHRKNNLEQEIRLCEDSILADNTRIGVINNQIETTQAKLDNLPARSFYEKQIFDLEEQITSTKAECDSIDTTSLETLINETNEAINEQKTKLLEQQNIIEKEYSEKSADSISTKSSLETKIKMLTAEINKLKSIKDVCPTCGQKLPDVHKPDTSQQEAELNDCNTKLLEVSKYLDELSSDRRIKIDGVKYEYQENTLDLNNKLDTNTQLLNTYKRNKTLLTNSINTLTTQKITAQSNLDNLERNKKDYTDTIENLKGQLLEISEKIVYNNKCKDNFDLHLGVVNKMLTAITRDFRGYLLTNVIEFINKKAKEYSKDVFDTEKINFVVEGNNISISYDDKEYENLSGGEKQKVDLIVQLAIRDMLCTFLDFSSNIIVLDELFDNLDDIGCQRVLNLISNKISDVDSIYIVTHHSDIQIPMDNEVVVVKGVDKISRIRR